MSFFNKKGSETPGDGQSLGQNLGETIQGRSIETALREYLRGNKVDCRLYRQYHDLMTQYTGAATDIDSSVFKKATTALDKGADAHRKAFENQNPGLPHFLGCPMNTTNFNGPVDDL